MKKKYKVILTDNTNFTDNYEMSEDKINEAIEILNFWTNTTLIPVVNNSTEEIEFDSKQYYKVKKELINDVFRMINLLNNHLFNPKIKPETKKAIKSSTKKAVKSLNMFLMAYECIETLIAASNYNANNNKTI